MDDGKFHCLACSKLFSNYGNARRHYREFHQTFATENSFFCYVCDAQFQLKRYRDTHMLSKHGISQKMMKAQIIPEDL